jgi:hypothetical protein
MNKIKIKFNLKDELFFLRENKVSVGKVINIQFQESEKEVTMKYTMIAEVLEGRFAGDNETFIIFENKLFKTKANLLKSL